MNKNHVVYKLILILEILLLLSVVPVFALDCNKKPCHRDCINSQPNSVQVQCRCNSRKKVYYNLWRDSIPEYDMTCDGTFEQYAVKYCAAKRRYDNYMLNPAIYANNYTPQYDPICDGSYAEYAQNIQVLKQTQAINNHADALRNQHVYHSGFINHYVDINYR